MRTAGHPVLGDMERARAIVLAALAILLAACDVSGTTVTAVNEWSEDVIVTVHGVDSTEGSRRVPAGTWGTVLNAWGGPRESARVVVYDEGCGELASLPLTTADATVHVSTLGVANLEHDVRVPGATQRATFAGALCP